MAAVSAFLLRVESCERVMDGSEVGGGDSMLAVAVADSAFAASLAEERVTLDVMSNEVERGATEACVWRWTRSERSP